MVYIEAVLTNNDHNVKCPFRVDADDMKELMDNVSKIVKNMLVDSDCSFDIVSFSSNTINQENFKKWVEMYLNSPQS